MLGVLLETKARKQRRVAGATLSVAAHVAIIAAVGVGAAQGTPAPYEKPRVIPVSIAPPPEPRHDVRRQSRTTSTDTPRISTDVVIRHIDAPNITPTELPPIDMTQSAAGDSIVIGGKSSATPATFGSLFTDEPSDTRDWDVRELLMHVITPATPRYPESLRSAGVDGRVLVQFTVDTAGRVDLSSVRILESTHDLFTRAVRDALGKFRFVPAQVGGRRVSALAQMPFEFHITR